MYVETCISLIATKGACLFNFIIDTRSPVSIDATTGPHVSVLIQLLPDHQNKHCSLEYGTNSTLQNTSSSIWEDHNEIEYALYQLEVGVAYSYSVSCSMVFDEVSEFRFTDKGTFTPGILLECIIIMS